MKLGRLQKAFSLTEVTIALGIIGFCALAVMGLLPVAVQSYRRGHDQTKASQILGNFLVGFQSPSDASNSTGVFKLPYPFANLGWTNGGGVVSNTIYFSADGAQTNSSITTNSRYTLTYTLTSPTNSSGFGGMVYASVTWPSAATNNPQGTLQGMVYFNSPSQK